MGKYKYLKVRPLRFTFGMALLIAILLTNGVFGKAALADGEIEHAAALHAPALPFDTSIEFAQSSDSTGDVTLRISTIDRFELANATAEIVLPDEVELISGSTSWEGSVAPSSQVSFTVSIRTANDGLHKIIGTLRASDVSGIFVDDIITDTDVVYLDVKGGSIQFVGKMPPDDGFSEIAQKASPEFLDGIDTIAQPFETPNAQPAPSDIDESLLRPLPEIPVSESESGIATVLSVGGQLTITGQFFYLDSEDVWRPLVWGTVTAYDDEPVGFVQLGTTITGTDGRFTIGPITNNDGPGEGGLDVFVRVFANNSAVSVINTADVVYDATTFLYNDTQDGTLDVGPWPIGSMTANERGAWSIFSYHNGANAGWNYLQNAGPNYATSHIDVRFPMGAGHGTHYHRGDEIHIEDEATARAPSVVLHEYGHHVMWDAYDAFPPSFCPSPHFIESVSNVVCAWTEGFADFFPSAVLDDPIWTFPSGTQVDLESPTWNTQGWDEGDWVEGRIAGALWDINDAAPIYNDGDDYHGEGFLNIWNVFETQDDNTFSEFWGQLRLDALRPKSIRCLILYSRTQYLTLSPSFRLHSIF